MVLEADDRGMLCSDARPLGGLIGGLFRIVYINSEVK